MPCNSDYMNPTAKEAQIKRTSVLLVYALTALGAKVPADITRRANDYYGADRGPKNDYNNPKPTRSADAVVALLCKTVNNMSDADRERVIYNAHDKTARDLAEWYEEHQKADREREAREAAAKTNKALRQSAKAKLSADERRAIGL
jgi:hypothetical protein